MMSNGLICLVLLAISGVIHAQQTYKVCVTAKEKELCRGLKKGDSPLDCDEVYDYADCAQRIAAGAADFGVLTAEAAAVAATFHDADLRATHQIRHYERLNDDHAFHAVVVVRNDFKGSLSKARFCHPGYSDSRAWTDRVLKKVERSSISGSDRRCHEKKTGVENEVASAANFFGPSCRPGDWSPDEAQDRKLKKQYHSLCDLCDNPSKCSYNSQALGSHVAALKCLKERGDAAYVALEYVKEFFGLDGKNAQNKRGNASDFSFLCENNSRKSLTGDDSCPWVREPWPAIVTNVNKTRELSGKLSDWLSGSRNRAIDNWRDYLARILLKDSSTAQKLPEAQSLKQYAGPELMTPSYDSCNRVVRWCAATDLDYHKCSWLARAVESHDLSPRLECMQPSGEEKGIWGCYAAVKEGTADIVTSDSTFAEIARSNFGLRPLLYQETDNDHAYKALAVVRANSTIKKLGDLTKMRAAACFNQYGTIAMSAWLDLERSRIWHCPTNKDLLKVFPRVCAPGADSEHFNFSRKISEPLCVQCAARPELISPGVNGHTCATNASNLYYGDLGALRCLQDRRADVAFIDLRGVPHINRTLSEYRVLCRNGSETNQTGLNVDFDCSLSEGIGGEILTNRDVTVKSADALFLLNSMQLWFDEGLGRFGDNVVINMFADRWGPQRIQGVLFKPSSLGFVDLQDTSSQQVQAFRHLQERRKYCDPNSARSVTPTALTFTLTMFAAVIARFR